MKKKVFIIAIILSFVDLLTKTLIFSINSLSSPKVIIDNFFRIERVKNFGAAFSSFQNMNIVLIIISLIVLIYLILSMNKQKESKLLTLSYGLLMGGLIGNLVDRISYSYVRDFLSFRIFGYDFAIFNIADMGIVIGAILLIIISFTREKKYENNK